MKLQSKTLEKLRQLINEETKYRSGPELVKFFNELGFKESYGPGFPSRWIYTDEKLLKLNEAGMINQCIKKLFNPIDFINNFDELDDFIAEFDQYLEFDGYKIIRNKKEIILKSIDEINENKNKIEDIELSSAEFKEISISKLGIGSDLEKIISFRLNEIKNCLSTASPLAAIFLSGSALEGILFGLASKYPKNFNQSVSSPKKDNKVKDFNEWNLNDFIDVSHDIGLIKHDVKKFSCILRDFRNYIHPYEQMVSKFNPDGNTAMICWTVLKAAICQLSDNFHVLLIKKK